MLKRLGEDTHKIPRKQEQPQNIFPRQSEHICSGMLRKMIASYEENLKR